MTTTPTGSPTDSRAAQLDPLAQYPRTSLDLIRAILSLRHVMKEERRLFMLSVLLVMCLQLCTIGVAVVTAYLTARIAVDDVDGATFWIVLLALCIILVGVLSWVESWWSHMLAYRLLSHLRLAVHAAVARIAPAGLAGRRSGEVAGTAVDDVEQLEWFYAHTAAASISSVITPFIVMSVSAVFIGPIAFLLTFGILLLIVPLWLLAPMQARQGEAVRRELSTLKAESLEGAQGMRDVLALGRADAYIARIRSSTEAHQRARMSFMTREGVEKALIDVSLSAVSITMIAISIGMVASGALSVTLAPVVVSLAFGVFVPITMVSSMWQRLGEMAASAKRVDVIISAPSPVSDAAATSDAFDAAADIRFDDVTVRYGGTPVVTGLNVTIREGELTALVGSSGSGKSTLANLLVRFIDPVEGEIRVGARSIATVDSSVIRQNIVLVPQTSYALRGSLRENMLLADPAATDSAIAGALRGAALGDFADELDENIGEGGGTLSGGQLQRLAIARALLLDPDVLVLDEPVANLDALAESSVMQTLSEARRGRTTIIISHRISTMRVADRVLMLDKGEVIGDGPHDELMRRSETYRALLTLAD